MLGHGVHVRSLVWVMWHGSAANFLRRAQRRGDSKNTRRHWTPKNEFITCCPLHHTTRLKPWRVQHGCPGGSPPAPTPFEGPTRSFVSPNCVREQMYYTHHAQNEMRQTNTYKTDQNKCNAVRKLMQECKLRPDGYGTERSQTGQCETDVSTCHRAEWELPHWELSCRWLSKSCGPQCNCIVWQNMHAYPHPPTHTQNTHTRNWASFALMHLSSLPAFMFCTTQWPLDLDPLGPTTVILAARAASMSYRKYHLSQPHPEKLKISYDSRVNEHRHTFSARWRSLTQCVMCSKCHRSVDVNEIFCVCLPPLPIACSQSQQFPVCTQSL